MKSFKIGAFCDCERPVRGVPSRQRSSFDSSRKLRGARFSKQQLQWPFGAVGARLLATTGPGNAIFRVWRNKDPTDEQLEERILSLVKAERTKHLSSEAQLKVAIIVMPKRANTEFVWLYILQVAAFAFGRHS